MELKDYATALRRYWTTWTGVALAGVLAALAVVLFSTPRYAATAEVFVASTAEGNSGSQFVAERVPSYPDIAESRAVLGPVIDDLGLSERFAVLKAKVEAVNPPDTSLIRITVTDEDPVWATDLANAVADEFKSVVEDLEEPRNGETPVALTVTDVASVPTDPVFPLPGLFLLMGLVVGGAVGVAAAIVRSRRDHRLYRADDVRAAWGIDGERLSVYSAPERRRRRDGKSGRPVVMTARRLETLAGQRKVQVLVMPLTTDGEPAARAFVRNVADELAEWDVPVKVHGAVGDDGSALRPGVHLAVGSPLAPLRELRRVAGERDGVVLVVQAGHDDQEDLREIRSLFDAVDARVLAVVLLEGSRGREQRIDPPEAAAAGARMAPSRERVTTR